jgi:hypothetical protein
VVVNVVKLEEVQSFGFHAMEIAGERVPRVFCYLVEWNKWMWICAVLSIVLLPLISHAQDTVWAAEPPQVRALLNEAMALERSASNVAQIRRAATLYCKASRLGSIEAQYRLGLLYLYGRGVPRNIDFASSLFSQAAQQGHAKALNMLEAVRLRSLKLPPCLV